MTLFFNGIDRTTGEYSSPPLDERTLAARVAEVGLDLKLLRSLDQWSRDHALDDPRRRPIVEVRDPDDLSEAGWALVIPTDIDRRILRALEPLTDLRRREAGRLYCEPLQYRAGESASDFLTRYKAKPGAPANPERVPYYLLLVGSPEQIPFRFQTELDPQYAVGRLWLGSDTAGYHAYAQTVERVESGRVVRRRELTLFGVRNENDPATEKTLHGLVEPLAARLATWRAGKGGRPEKWEVSSVLGPQATHANLSEVVGQERGAAVLFTASHGMVYPFDDERQRQGQGGLICSDWRGPKTALEEHHIFQAQDVPDDADLSGLITVHFACHSAGSPEYDSYHVKSDPSSTDPAKEPEGPRKVAREPFVAALPQRLLSRPRGTALAVLGHVDRTWTSSFDWSVGEAQVEAFSDLLWSLFDGHRLGWAMESMNQSYAALGAILANLWMDKDRVVKFCPDFFVRIFKATQDAGNFVVLGDPAVRVAVRR
jgi:hypothetical protein